MELQKENVKLAIKAFLGVIERERLGSVDDFYGRRIKRSHPWEDEDFVDVEADYNDRGVLVSIAFIYGIPSQSGDKNVDAIPLRMGISLMEKELRVITCCQGGFSSEVSYGRDFWNNDAQRKPVSYGEENPLEVMVREMRGMLNS